ncbi:MAG: DUF4826 family protein [Paraglaciecola sp.]|uniref:DUF4826 family protein n=1 Tax=Paraglaciecola sp. TaxID=1920173 RepID=UPI00329A68E5
MNQLPPTPNTKELDEWVKETLNAGVYSFLEIVNIDSAFVEAKAAWVLPFQILIGKIRAQTQPEEFTWIVCGNLPTDYVGGSVAATPRDAAKHFSLKWQLNASQIQAKNNHETSVKQEKDDDANNIINHAEALYELAQNDSLWSPQDQNSTSGN